LKKLLILLTVLLLPSLAFGKATSRLRSVIYEKLKVPVNTGFYVDSLLNSEIQQATLEIITVTGCLTKTDTIVNGANVFRRVIGRDSGLKVVAVFKRKTYGSISNLIGLSEVTENLFGQAQPSTPQFTQDHSGDSLVVWIQPTPTSAESLWVKYQCFAKRYDSLWLDSLQAINPENPLSPPYEKLIPLLVAARLLTREAPFRNDVAEMLYREYLQSVTFLPEALVKRMSELWPLPRHLQETAGEPK